MNTVFFDIDGTILLSDGAGSNALGAAMQRLFGLQETKSVEVHGRTDRSIVFDLLRENGIEDSEDNWHRLYDTYLGLLPGSIATGNPRLLPGVEQLLYSLLQRDDFSIGLLTGNSKPAADMKLAHFGMHTKFEYGGFGTEYENRDDVAGQAKSAARKFLGARFREEKLWVIGDTIHDITCAKAISARSIAVLTGGSARENLQTQDPDHIFEDLSDTHRVIDSMLNCS